jgi:hypothetical protein
MKFLIQHDLRCATSFDPNWSANELAETKDYYSHLASVASQFCLQGKFEVSPDSASFSIHAQKMTLDERNMNAFFAEFLDELFDIEIRYAKLGGAGCDFSVELVSAVPRLVV